MEQTVRFELQEQVSNVALVTSDQVKAGKRTEKPPITQPQAKTAKTGPEARALTSTRIPLGRYWEFKGLKEFEHLDHRWLRTVWWDKCEQAWKPRDPSKPITWAHSPDWKPETAKEAEERRNKGIGLDYRDMLPGGIYRFFDKPWNKVRVEHIYSHLEKPNVFVRNLDGSGGKFVFADELECTLQNSNRARNNWVRRRRAKCRKLGIYCFF